VATAYYPGFENESESGETHTDEVSYLSLGQGISLAGAIGMQLSDGFAAELGLGYLYGLANSVEDTRGDDTGTRSLTGSLIQLAPSVVVSSNAFGLRVYSRFGLLVGIPSVAYNVESKYDDKGANKTVTREVEGEYSGNVTLGLVGAVGAESQLSDTMSLFFELNAMSASWAPGKLELTKAMEDGKDELADAKVRDKETEFVSELSSNPNDKTDDSKPRQRLATVTFPFSNVGVMVGVRIRL